MLPRSRSSRRALPSISAAPTRSTACAHSGAALSKSNPEIAALRPIIMIKEGNTGLGMQLRLGAGPLINAAAAAKLCAGLAENDRHCETTVFDGQRLSMRGSEKGQDKSQDKNARQGADKNQDKNQELGAAS